VIRVTATAAPALLLLTATITPPSGVPALARTDPAERLEDYRRALAFYLSLPGFAVDRIVFAENSSTDLSALEELMDGQGHGKQVELVSFYGLDYPVEQGRAVGEIRLIETALSRSGLLGALGESEAFWKVTGRLRVTNMQRLVASAPPGAALYADFRRVPRPWVDLRALACTRSGFCELLWPRVDGMSQAAAEAAGCSAPEEWLYGELAPRRAALGVVPRLRVEPRMEGYSGFGEDLARPSRRVWSTLRGGARRLLPGLWL